LKIGYDLPTFQYSRISRVYIGSVSKLIQKHDGPKEVAEIMSTLDRYSEEVESK